MTALAVGELSETEVEAAVSLWREAGLLRPWNDARADIAMALHGPASTILAGRIDERLVATAMTGCDGHRGWVYYLAVAASERRRGFGRTMMRAAERWCAEHGVARMNLMVRAENIAVAQFYAALGYADKNLLILGKTLEGM